MAEDTGISPVVQQTIEVATAGAAQKQTALGGLTMSAGGAWAWLGGNAPQLGIIIALIGLVWAYISSSRQRRALQAVEDSYHARIEELERRYLAASKSGSA